MAWRVVLKQNRQAPLGKPGGLRVVFDFQYAYEPDLPVGFLLRLVSLLMKVIWGLVLEIESRVGPGGPVDVREDGLLIGACPGGLPSF